MSKIILNGIEYSNGITYQELQPVIYSTEEREIGCWTSGKPLYQKSVFIAQYSPKSAVQTFAHGVSNLEQGWVVEAVKFRNSESGGSGADDFSKNIIGQDVYGFVDTSNVVRGQVWGVDGTNIKVRNSGSNTTNTTYDCWVMIRYTKTTDVVGSGSWTPSGVPSIHYSTNEQVIGTWINNKPLYEQTIHMSANFSSTKTYSIPTAEDLFLVDGFFVCASGSTQYQVPLNYTESGYSSYSGWNKTSHNVYFRLAGFSSTDVYATVRYTKTTD